MSKREQMRNRAKKELARKQKVKKSTSSKIEEEKEPPTFFSGVFLIFAGSMVFAIAFTAGQGAFGLLASAPFVFIGMQRIARATAAKNEDEVLRS